MHQGSYFLKIRYIDLIDADITNHLLGGSNIVHCQYGGILHNVCKEFSELFSSVHSGLFGRVGFEPRYF